jgi:hypothetical protein
MRIIHVQGASGEIAELDEAAFAAGLRAGEIGQDAWYWTDGLAAWAPVSQYKFEEPADLESRVVYQFKKDPKRLTKALVFFLCCSAVFGILSIASDLGQVALLQQATITEAQIDANDNRQALITIGYILTNLCTGVVFLMWIHRANANSHAFGAAEMQFTPGWSVGYYFIPFVNLFRPYQVMCEIRQVSVNPRGWQKVPGTALVGCWWALWIFSGLMGRVRSGAYKGAEDIEALQMATGTSILAELVWIPLCIVAIVLVRSVYRNQLALVSNSAPQ